MNRDELRRLMAAIAAACRAGAWPGKAELWHKAGDAFDAVMGPEPQATKERCCGTCTWLGTAKHERCHPSVSPDSVVCDEWRQAF